MDDNRPPMHRYNYPNTVKRILALILAFITGGATFFFTWAIFHTLKHPPILFVFFEYGVPILVFLLVYVYVYYSVWEGDKEQTWRH